MFAAMIRRIAESASLVVMRLATLQFARDRDHIDDAGQDFLITRDGWLA
jgi:hypothetical protein